MKQLKFRLEGLGSLLMHSDRFANPLDEDAIEHKKLTSKRNKTVENLHEIAKSEWLGSLYYNDDLGIHIPTANLRKNLIEGARKFKLGKHVEGGVFFNSQGFPLEYEGSKKPETLYRNKEFVDCRSVVVGRAKLMRYRPIFKHWALSGTLEYEETVIDEEQIKQSFEKAGQVVGLGDYRPLFGRYSVSFD